MRGSAEVASQWPATVTLNVTHVNSPLIAANDSYSVVEAGILR